MHLPSCWHNVHEKHIYSTAHATGYTLYHILFFPLQATAWVTLFLSLGDKRRGYAKQNIATYIHAMVYHVPRSMRMHKGIRNFSGQGNKMRTTVEVRMEQSNQMNILYSYETAPTNYWRKAFAQNLEYNALFE